MKYKKNRIGVNKGIGLEKDVVSSNGRKRVLAGIASMPDRSETLQASIDSIYWQVDEIHVYLNNFDYIPSFLKRARINIYRSQDHGDLKDVGKFFALNNVHEGVIFTLDDDIRYPADYVDRMMEALEATNYKAIVGVHGIILPEHPKSFFDRKVFTFYTALESAVPVSFLGTGTCAFDIENVGISVSSFASYGMADLYLGIHAKNSGIPSIAIGRQEGWLEDIGRSDNSIETLYESTRLNSAPHNELIKGAVPWGQADIMQRFNYYINIDLLTDEVRFALNNIKHADQKNPGLPEVPEGSKMPKPYLGSLKWIEIFSNPSTLERVYENVLVHRKTQQVQLAALSGLWTQNKFSCVENSRRIAEQNHENPIFLLEHAKYCAGIHLNDEARQYFEAAARKVSSKNDASDLKPQDVILEYFGFLIRTGHEEEAGSYSHFLKEKFFNHPIYNRGMFEIHLSQGNFDAAMPYLTSLFQNMKRRQFRSVRELVGSIASKYASDLKHHDIIPRIEPECIESCKGSYTLLLEILKISILLGDSAGAEKCWSMIVVMHSHELDRRPELRWYYYSNIKHYDRSIDVIGGQYFSSKLQSEEYDLNSLEYASCLKYSSGSQTSGAKVSVVMTVYNGGETIKYAVQSILNQSHRDLEVIIVDDVSSDDTVKIIEGLAADDNRIRLLKNSKNIGPYASRNVALSVATGEFIAIHDADDVALPNRIERQISAFSDKVMAVLGQHVRMDRAGRVQLENDGSILGHGPMTLMLRHSVFDDVGGFSEVRTRGDKEFESRIEYYYGAHALTRIPELLVLCLHDLNSNSHEYTNSPERLRSLIVFKEGYLRRHSSGMFRESATQASN